MRQGHRLPDAVDGRGDTYALGLMLRDFLRAPFTPGLADVFARCTSPAADQYACPADLGRYTAEALRRAESAGVPAPEVADRAASPCQPSTR